jgi:hypothetical protein
MIVVGNGHETGAEPDTEALYADLESWVRANFDVEAIDYRWSAQDYLTPDRVPYVGHSPMSKLVLVATGFQKRGLNSGTAAAMNMSEFRSDLRKMSSPQSSRKFERPAHSGEVMSPLAVGAVARGHVADELGSVLAGTTPGRSGDDAITLFNSVGVGLQDLAGVRLLIDRARAEGIGLEVELGR